ncbi:hypothetical protein FQN50_008865 [Emmonsiellopsis sp. PD_5]|nr:hypothetical protein FQN50_008865 [Emmonsiellopsis sp. PD_5]
MADELASLFLPKFRPAFIDFANGPTESIESRFLSFVLPDHPSAGSKFDNPVSCHDLLWFLSHIFTPDFCDAIGWRCYSFDRLVVSHGTSLADVFISERSRISWLRFILVAIYLKLCKTRAEAPSAYLRSLPSPSVEQIVLRGPNLKEAWIQCPQTASWEPPTANFSPQQAGKPMIFNGAATNCVPPGEFHQLCSSLGLGGSVPNQMAPFGVFHTSFYGLRSFLWSTFCKAVTSADLSNDALDSLDSNFEISGVKYRGVLLLAFHTNTPAPANLNAEILDESMVDPWDATCRTHGVPLVPLPSDRSQYWTALAHIHRKTSTTWPDVLHAPEVEATRAALAPYTGEYGQGLLPATGPMWRSAHCTFPAVDALDTCRAGIFAVTFESSLPPIVHVPLLMPKDPSEDDRWDGPFAKAGHKISRGLCSLLRIKKQK